MNIKHAFLGLLLCLSPNLFAQGNATIVTYAAPEGLTTSPDFTVSVNHKKIWTESVGNGGMENLNVANYSAAGAQTITVTASSPIKK